jgi:hypothetical protein
MLIREELSQVDRHGTLLHELVHALQDEHSDLAEVVQWAPDNTDRSAALSALAEGDAMSAMVDGLQSEGKTALSYPAGHIQERFFGGEGSEDASIPPIIARSLKVSYVDGLTFVHGLRRRGGWKEVDRIWKTPPTTTEQLLHLDKYDAQEPAVAVPAPAAPSEEWKLLLHDVWGEQNLRLVFEEWTSKEEAKVAAAGWGGDRIAVFARKDAFTLAWHIVADSPEDAREMFKVFRAGIKPAKSSEDSNPDAFCGAASESAPRLAVRLDGSRVFVASAPYLPEAAGAGACLVAGGWIETQMKNLAQE